MLRLSQILVPVLSSMTAASAFASPAKTINVAAIVADSAMSKEVKAQALADTSETLLAAQALFPAAHTAKAALAIDAANPKARLLMAVIAPQLELKGIVGRVEPLVQTRPEIHSRFAKATARFRKVNSPLADFALNGPKDIHTESDAQELIARYIYRLDQLRRTLNDLKNGPEIPLHTSPDSLVQFTVAQAMVSCVAEIEQGRVYDFSNCPATKTAEHRLNRADLEAAQQLVAGYQTLLTFLNAWDFSGAYQTSIRVSGNREHDMKLFLANAKFGTLRKGNAIGVIPDIAKDAVIGARYAISMQQELCPQGKQSTQNRPGYAFEKGLCVRAKNKLERTLGLIELMLKGPTAVAVSESEVITVDAPAFFSQPLKDVREIVPAKFDKCGRVTSLNDRTVNGILPNADVHRLLAKQTCRK